MFVGRKRLWPECNLVGQAGRLVALCQLFANVDLSAGPNHRMPRGPRQ